MRMHESALTWQLELTMRGVRAKDKPRMSVGMLLTNDLHNLQSSVFPFDMLAPKPIYPFDMLAPTVIKFLDFPAAHCTLFLHVPKAHTKSCFWKIRQGEAVNCQVTQAYAQDLPGNSDESGVLVQESLVIHLQSKKLGSIGRAGNVRCCCCCCS